MNIHKESHNDLNWGATGLSSEKILSLNVSPALWHLYTSSKWCGTPGDHGSYMRFPLLHMCNSVVFSVIAVAGEWFLTFVFMDAVILLL